MHLFLRETEHIPRFYKRFVKYAALDIPCCSHYFGNYILQMLMFPYR